MNMNETLRSGLIYLVISVLFVWMVVKKLPVGGEINTTLI